MTQYKNYFILLLPIIVLATFFRVYHVDQTYGFYGDQGQDLIAIDHWVKTGQIPIRGILTSIGTFHMGPLYYYLIAPFAVLLNGDSIAPVYLFVISGIFLVVTGFIFGLKFFNLPTAIILSFLLAISPHAIFVSRGAYSPNLQIFTCLLMLTLLFQFMKTGKPIFLFFTYFVIGVGTQFHYNFLVNAVIIGTILMLYKRKQLLKWQMILSVFLGFLVPFIPFLIGQIGVNFWDIKGLYYYLTTQSTHSGKIILASFIPKINFPLEIFYPADNLPWYLRLLVNQKLTIFILVILTMIGFTKNTFSSGARIILLYFLLGTLTSFLGKLNFWWWYNDYYSISILILISIFIGYLYQYSKIKFLWLVPFTIFVGWSIFLLPTVYTIDRSPRMTKDVAQIILKDQATTPQRPPIKLYLYNLISVAEGFEYIYFIKKSGVEVIRSTKAVDADYVIIEKFSSLDNTAYLGKDLTNFSEIGQVKYFGNGNTITAAVVLKRQQP